MAEIASFGTSELENANVLFMDVVGWSKLPIDQQTGVAFKLQQIVSGTAEFRRAETEGMVALPTGDGMALVFFRRPEAPVRCAIEIWRAVKEASHDSLQLRMGVHSGMVYQGTDINARKTVVGDGINIAQRVMDCGDAGHILLSEGLASQLRRVSTWADILHDIGEYEVKHGVRVHLYNLFTPEVGNPSSPTNLRVTPTVEGPPQSTAAAGAPTAPTASVSAVAPPTLTHSAAPGPTAGPAGGSQRVALLYRRKANPDEQVVQGLEAYLTAAGYEVFVDRNPTFSVEWAKELESRVRTADAVIPLLSESALHSEMLAHEIQSAHETSQQQNGKPRIITLRLRYENPFPEEFGAIVDPTPQVRWSGPEDDSRVFAELLAVLRGPAQTEKARVRKMTIAMEELESIGGAVPLNSKFYEERPIDAEFLAAIARRDSIVLLKGARQMGKTSLLARGLHQARQTGSKVLLTDFQQFNAQHMESLGNLYHALAESLADQLDLDVFLAEVWNAQRSPNANFERYIRREVLEKLECPLVWSLDEVDRLFTCPFGSEVFALFRTWHNKRALDPGGQWSRFTLAIAYATEAHLFITDINQSPFNVGTRLLMEDFSVEQVADLNERYGGPVKPNEMQRYYTLVGGHPFLVRRGLNTMAQGMEFAEFEAAAANDDGPLSDHLRRLLITVAQDDALCEVARIVLQGHPCPNTESFYRLRSSGVMSGESPRDIRPRCQVYETYLKRHLLSCP